MTKTLETIAVIAASIVAAFASIVGLFALFEIQKQNANSERQLLQIEQQSEMLLSQLQISEKLIENDSVITFLQLLQTMRPEWSYSGLVAAFGGDEGFEKYSDEEIAIKVEFTNEGSLPLIVSQRSTIRMYSCVTGQLVDISSDVDQDLEVAKASIQSRTSTIMPGETETIYLFKDTIVSQGMVDALKVINSEYAMEFSVLLYTEGSETVGDYVGSTQELNSYFRTISVGGEDLATPFLADMATFSTWVTVDLDTLGHSLTTQNCSADHLRERFARSSR